MAKCKLCKKRFRIITNTHLASIHGWRIKDYIQRFGANNCGFLRPNLLPKDDPRYKKWRESLKKRPPTWSKGFTKETHPSIAKMAETFKKRKIDNFSRWREKLKKNGKWPFNCVSGEKIIYTTFEKSGDLAELIGVILGDGNIGKFPRTEGLTIACNSNNIGFINRYAGLITKLFRKSPYVAKVNKAIGCTRVRIYQKGISKRLGIPTGNRSRIKIDIPKWILKNRRFLLRYLRGLYEAEGSFCVHKPTCTYKFLFSNRNRSLLENVYRGLMILGFHPHRSKNKIQVSRKEEVYRVKNLLKFRQY